MSSSIEIQPASIYIVEDEYMILTLLESLMAKNHLQVLGSSCKASKAKDEILQIRPEILLLDVKLGEDSGVDLAKKIKKHYSPEIVFITALQDEQTLAAIRDITPIACLSKPARESHIITAIQIALEFAEYHAQNFERANLLSKELAIGNLNYVDQLRLDELQTLTSNFITKHYPIPTIKIPG